MNAAALQIRAIRATLVAALSQLDSIEAVVCAAHEAQPCEHPADDRDKHVATFDAPERWMCKRCGFIGGEKAAEG